MFEFLFIAIYMSVFFVLIPKVYLAVSGRSNGEGQVTISRKVTAYTLGLMIFIFVNLIMV